MTVSISSLAFPAGTSPAIQAATLRRHGFTHLDPRALAAGELDPLATPAQIAELRRILDGEGIAPGCVYGYPGDSAHVRRLRDYAAALGADMVRVLTGRPVTIDSASALLSAALDGPGDRGPMLVVQNHAGSSLDLVDAIAVMRAVDHPRLRLACSPDHELIHGRWTPDLLAAAVPWTAIWFWQDVQQDATGRWSLCLPGAGADPWTAIVASTPAPLRISCKWEHCWHPELPGPDIALPAYAAEAKRLFNRC